jgi:membrane-bound inhibitor of C-type lysozyme
MTTSGNFKGQQAPCGRVVDGETYQDFDSETVVTRGMEYACGCRTIQHEYHDGSVSRMVVRHDGRVLVDELLSAE